jgi:hypothetical protein
MKNEDVKRTIEAMDFVDRLRKGLSLNLSETPGYAEPLQTKADIQDRLKNNFYQKIDDESYLERKAAKARGEKVEARFGYGVFRDDAFAELGIVGNPKADLLLGKAWDLGHAYGYQEVWSHLQDLVDLIK